MPFYTFWQRIAYRLKAKSRHGVHSPFVYDFIEQVLLRRDRTEFPLPVHSGLCRIQFDLVAAIICHYRPATLVYGMDQSVLYEEGAGVLHLLSAPEFRPGRYSQNDIVIITGLYKGKQQAKEWEKIVAHDAVPLSIDVFEAGILFFRHDFKVKQHFILKYR